MDNMEQALWKAYNQFLIMSILFLISGVFVFLIEWWILGFGWEFCAIASALIANNYHKKILRRYGLDG